MRIEIEENFRELCIKAAQIGGNNKFESEYGSWALNHYDSWFSKIYKIEDFNKVFNKILSNSAPKSLLIKENDLTPYLESLLLKNNFELIVEQTGMFLNLSELDDFNDDFTSIKIIDDEYDKWITAAESIFGNKNSSLYKPLFKDKDIYFLGLKSNDEIVTTTMLFRTGDIMGLHLVGTSPEHRGKGYGALITKYALKFAKELGCKYSVLQASKMGKPVYQKVGYIPSKKISHWEYRG